MPRIASLAACLALITASAMAGDATTVFAKRTVRVGAVVTAKDVELREFPEHLAAGVAASLEQVIGYEVRRNLYANRPVMMEDVGAPTVVRRNSLVTLAYRSGALELTALGRAIDSAGLDEPIRVVNIDSRVTVVGTVMAPGLVRVDGATRLSGSAR
jgi:flagella basal body P-ring formation protein FlgA